MRTTVTSLITCVFIGIALAACSAAVPATVAQPAGSADHTAWTTGVLPGKAGEPATGAVPPVSDGGCAPGVVAQICATVSVTGGATVSGRGSTIAPMPPSADPSITCSQLANAVDGGNIGAQLPSVGGHAVAWDTTLANYRGPGEYPVPDFHLTIDDNSYSMSDGAHLHVDIDPDFATTITFTDLQSTGQSPGTVSGRITWTCVDRSLTTPGGI